MTFTTSVKPDITESIPGSLSQRTLALIAANRTRRYDVEINGLGFCIDPDGARDGANGPYVRQSVPVRKQQTDVSDQAGEQSLDGYWIRSQASWHHGAGVNYYEPGAEKQTEFRFAESSGLNIWTQGKVSAHKKMALAQAGTTTYVANAGLNAGTQYVIYLSDTAILGWDGSSYALNSPLAGHTGRYYFFGYKNYYKVGWNASPSATVGIWAGAPNALVAKNAVVEPFLWYCKDRLIVAHGANLFEVPPLTAVPVDLNDPTVAIHKPQDQQTVWVDVVEGPAAIYAAHTSGIVRFALQDASSGSTPKLSQAYRVLELPAGETLKAMFGYLGRFLILSTSAGIRVCGIDGQGNLTMGQVIVEASLGDFRAMSALGDIVYIGGAYVPAYGTTGTGNLAGWGTNAGLLSLNLGQVVDGDALRFAYSMDERTDVSGTAYSSLVIGTNKYVSVSTSGVWKTHATDYVPGGYMALGRSRFNTLTPKVFSSLDLYGSIGTGTLRIDLLDEVDVSYYAVSMDATTGLVPSVALPLSSVHTFIRPLATFTWTSGAAPELRLIQLRALPSPQRVRQIRYPLRCHDVEEDRNGTRFGRPRFASERLAALEEMEQSGIPVVIQDKRTGEQLTAMIDEIDFQGEVAPEKGNANFGGVIRLTVTRLR